MRLRRACMDGNLGPEYLARFLRPQSTQKALGFTLGPESKCVVEYVGIVKELLRKAGSAFTDVAIENKDQYLLVMLTAEVEEEAEGEEGEEAGFGVGTKSSRKATTQSFINKLTGDLYLPKPAVPEPDLGFGIRGNICFLDESVDNARSLMTRDFFVEHCLQPDGRLRLSSDTLREILEIKSEDIDSQNPFGETALMIAAKQANSQACEILCEYKANCNLRTTHGAIALMHSIEHDIEETALRLCKILIPKTDLKIQNNWGMTCLHLAAFKGHESIVKLLLDAKADPHLKDINGYTPAHYAQEENCERDGNEEPKFKPAIIQLLQEHS